MNNLPMIISFGVVAIGVIITLVILLSSSNWQTTQGVMLESSYKENYHSPGSTNRSLFDYDLILKYEYSVGGVKYLGTKLYPALPNNISEEKMARDIINKYAKGSEVKVYYNLKNPEKAALETLKNMGIGAKLALIFFTLFVIALLGAGIYIFENYL